MQHEWPYRNETLFVRKDAPNTIVFPWGTARAGAEEALGSEVLRLAGERGVLRDRITALEQEAAGREELLAALRADQEVATGRYEAEWQRAEGMAKRNVELEAENSRLEGELHAAKAYSAVMAEEDKKLCLEVDRLRFAEGRLTSLRLEVDERSKRIAHLEGLLRGYETNGRLAKAIIDQQVARIESLTAEVRSADNCIVQLRAERGRLEPDLREAIKTGEEQGARLAAIQRSANEALTERGGPRWSLGAETGVEALIETIAKLDHDIAALEDCRREWLSWGTDAQKRLSRLDALLSSEQVPWGLSVACNNAFSDCLYRITAEVPAAASWRWFREQLGAPAGE